MRESKLEKKLREAVEEFGGKCLKFVSPGMRGVPDRLCLFPKNKHAFVEMKKPGGTLSPLQRKCIREFERLEHKVYVIDSEVGIEEFIREVMPK